MQLQYQRAHVLLALDHYEDAIETLDLVLTLAPKEPPVYSLLGTYVQILLFASPPPLISPNICQQNHVYTHVIWQRLRWKRMVAKLWTNSLTLLKKKDRNLQNETIVIITITQWISVRCQSISVTVMSFEVRKNIQVLLKFFDHSYHKFVRI